MTELPSPPADPPHRGLRFNTFSLLLLLTGASLLLATLVAIGRAFGVDSASIVLRALGPFLQYLPMAIVWIVGIVAAVRSRWLPQSAARLVIIACSGMLLTTIVGSLVQVVLITWVMSSQGPGAIGWIYGIYGIAVTLLQTVWMSLLVMAVFRGRKPSAMESPQ